MISNLWQSISDVTSHRQHYLAVRTASDPLLNRENREKLANGEQARAAAWMKWAHKYASLKSMTMESFGIDEDYATDDLETDFVEPSCSICLENVLRAISRHVLPSDADHTAKNHRQMSLIATDTTKMALRVPLSALPQDIFRAPSVLQRQRPPVKVRSHRPSFWKMRKWLAIFERWRSHSSHLCDLESTVERETLNFIERTLKEIDFIAAVFNFIDFIQVLANQIGIQLIEVLIDRLLIKRILDRSEEGAHLQHR